jgi:hypothetical protein
MNVLPMSYEFSANVSTDFLQMIYEFSTFFLLISNNLQMFYQNFKSEQFAAKGHLSKLIKRFLYEVFVNFYPARF